MNTIKPTPKQQGVPVPTEEMPLLEGPNGPQEHAPTEKGLGGLCWAEFFLVWTTEVTDSPDWMSHIATKELVWFFQEVLNLRKIAENLLLCWFSIIQSGVFQSSFSWWMEHFHRRYRAFAVAHQFLQMQDIEDPSGIDGRVKKQLSAQTRGFCAFFWCKNDTILFFLGRNW